jgi:hypothetical protein
MAFEAQGAATAYTVDKSGSTLPAALAPWTRIRPFEIDNPKVMQVLEQDGFALGEYSRGFKGIGKYVIG